MSLFGTMGSEADPMAMPRDDAADVSDLPLSDTVWRKVVGATCAPARAAGGVQREVFCARYSRRVWALVCVGGG